MVILLIRKIATDPDVWQTFIKETNQAMEFYSDQFVTSTESLQRFCAAMRDGADAVDLAIPEVFAGFPEKGDPSILSEQLFGDCNDLWWQTEMVVEAPEEEVLWSVLDEAGERLLALLL